MEGRARVRSNGVNTFLAGVFDQGITTIKIDTKFKKFGNDVDKRDRFDHCPKP